MMHTSYEVIHISIIIQAKHLLEIRLREQIVPHRGKVHFCHFCELITTQNMKNMIRSKSELSMTGLVLLSILTKSQKI